MLVKPQMSINKAFLKVKPQHSEIQQYESNQILEIKKSDPKVDTSELEAEIDQLVYELYELTEKEIEIVENSVK